MTVNRQHLSTYCTTIAQVADLVCITYHKTQIVAFDRLNISLDTGGWDGVTTRRKMNQASNQFGLGYSVYRVKGETWVRTPCGNVLRLERDITFARRAA